KDPTKVARFPIDLTTAGVPPVAELPGGRLVASTNEGRHAVLDLDTATIVRTFTVPRSEVARLAGADRSLALLDVGEKVAGFDDVYFQPSRPPVVVPLAGALAPRPLTGPGCPSSTVVTVSEDGALAITRAKDAWCL